MFVKPSGPRHTATEEREGVVIRIPSKRNIFFIGFLGVWLCGWLFGEVSAIAVLLGVGKREPGSGVFMFVWLTGWTVGGMFAMYAWLWQVKGCEVITLSPSAFGIKREVFGYGRSQFYDLNEIRELRVAPMTFNPADFRSGMAFWGIGGGSLAFDYGFKTYRFGTGVEEAEARVILQTILSRAPKLSKPS